MKSILLICLILLSGILFAQKNELKIPKKIKRSIPLLTQHLTINKNTEKEKVEAIYTWITENIEYDYDQLQSEKYLTGVEPINILKVKKAISTRNVELMKRKTV